MKYGRQYKENKQDTIDTSLKYKLKTAEINNIIKEPNRNKSWLHTTLRIKKTEDYNDVEATNEKKLENYIGNINRLQKHGDMSAIWEEIEKISKKPFIGTKELPIGKNNPSTATTNIDKLLDIHDQHIMGNFHKVDDDNRKDILELLEHAENTPGESVEVNKITSLRRKSPLYGYLAKRKWYEGGGN